MSSKKSTDTRSAKADNTAAPGTTKKAGTKGTKKKVSKKRSAAKRSPGIAKKAVAADSSSSVVSQERSSEAALSAAPDMHDTGKGITRLALVASLLALLIAAYAAYQFTLSSQLTRTQVTGLDDRLKFVVSELQSLRSGFDALNKNSTTDIKRIDDSLGAMQSSVTKLQTAADASIDEIKANLGESVARWKLDEVHSLLTRVNRIYQLTGDQAQALAGLRLAQSSLATIDNPRLEAVNTALAEDMLRVESDRNIDIVMLHNRLAGIFSLVPELLLIEDARAAEVRAEGESQPGGETAAGAEDSGILAAGKTLFSDIGSLVKHKNLDAPLQPSLDEETRFVLYESLNLNVQGAMVALLRRDNATYQSQLAFAADTLKAFFDLEQPDGQAIKDQLQALQSYDISLSTQAISLALSELNRVMILEN